MVDRRREPGADRLLYGSLRDIASDGESSSSTCLDGPTCGRGRGGSPTICSIRRHEISSSFERRESGRRAGGRPISWGAHEARPHRAPPTAIAGMRAPDLAPGGRPYIFAWGAPFLLAVIYIFTPVESSRRTPRSVGLATFRRAARGTLPFLRALGNTFLFRCEVAESPGVDPASILPRPC